MEFAHKVHLDCYQKVSAFMKDLFGEQVHVRDDMPILGLRMGSAFAQTGVWAWGEANAVVVTRAIVVREIELTPELMHYLLRKNDEMRFGGFGLDSDGDIFFQHALVGTTCSKEELRASVLAVGQVADDLDDQIVARWGGRKAYE
jgi:hypothetical protein